MTHWAFKWKKKQFQIALFKLHGQKTVREAQREILSYFNQVNFFLWLWIWNLNSLLIIPAN